jgi:hypothetical protein
MLDLSIWWKRGDPALPPASIPEETLPVIFVSIPPGALHRTTPFPCVGFSPAWAYMISLGKIPKIIGDKVFIGEGERRSKR